MQTAPWPRYLYTLARFEWEQALDAASRIYAERRKYGKDALVVEGDPIMHLAEGIMGELAVCYAYGLDPTPCLTVIEGQDARAHGYDQGVDLTGPKGETIQVKRPKGRHCHLALPYTHHGPKAVVANYYILTTYFPGQGIQWVYILGWCSQLMFQKRGQFRRFRKGKQWSIDQGNLWSMDRFPLGPPRNCQRIGPGDIVQWHAQSIA